MVLKGKRAQLTLFIIAGIVLVVGVLLFFIISTKNSENLSSKSTPLSNDVLDSLNSNIKKCLREETIDAINLFGLDRTFVRKYLEANIPPCISPFIEDAKKRHSLSENLKEIIVDYDGEVFSVILDYPIYASNEESNISLASFEHNINLYYEVPLLHDDECNLLTEESIRSFNNKFNVKVSEGTNAKYTNGSCLDKLVLNIKDTVEYTGDRSHSIGTLTYLLEPAGAEFDTPVDLELKYSDTDYENYIRSSIESDKFFELNKDLKIKYYDLKTEDYYLYMTPEDYWAKSSSADGVITARTYLFHGEKLPLDFNCKVKHPVIMQSPNNRVDLIFPEGITAKKSDESCLDSVDIIVGPKLSKSVTFGDKNYAFEPAGTKFSEPINYIYNYNLADISSPEFLYGHYNTGEMINGIWTPPQREYGSDGLPIDEIIERVPEELEIAYYDESSKTYVPWSTYVDARNKRIVAEVNHFSHIIPAQGCNDWNYYLYRDLFSIPKNSEGNCTGESAGPFEITYRAIPQESCSPKGNVLRLSAQSSLGDTMDIGNSEINATTVYISKITDADKKQAPQSESCAFASIIVALKGIGFESTIDSEATYKTLDVDYWRSLAHELGDKKFNLETLEEAAKTLSSEIFSGNGSGAEMCDRSLEIGCVLKDLCNRCWNDMYQDNGQKCVAGQNAGWHCSKARLDNCVKSNCGGGSEDREEPLTENPTPISNPISSGGPVVSEKYSIKKLAQTSDYLWFMASVGNKLYSGSYSSPQKFYYSSSPFTSWSQTQISSGDESTRVYNLNNRLFVTSGGGSNGNGGNVYADSSVCYDFPKGTAYVLGAEYHEGKYLISRNNGGKTEIYSCPCKDGQTCSLWKSIDGIFTFHMTSFNKDLYLIGTGTDSYRTSSGGKVLIVRDNGAIEQPIKSGPGSGVRGIVFDNKIFTGFSYDAEIWSSDGGAFKKEKSFSGFEHFGDFEIFDNKLFVSVVKEGGTPEIWYRNSNSEGGNWIKVFDSKHLGGYGVSGNLVNGAGFLTTLGDKLYFNINSPSSSRKGPGYVLEISERTTASSCSIFPNSNWQTATPASMGIDESKLQQLKNSVGGRGAVYYKGMKIYSWGSTTQKGDIASASKPILSLILFSLVSKGKIPSLNTPVSNYVGSCSGEITFHHLANMISGYNVGDGPGSKYAYNDYAIALYAKALFKASGSSAQATFNSVFSDLKFQNSPSSDSGSKQGRISISVDDFARIGLLVSCKGNWNGKQIIPSNYFDYLVNQVSNSISVSSSSCKNDPCGVGSFGGDCNQDRSGNGRGRYGYNFWVYNEEFNIGTSIPSDTLVLTGHAGKENMILIPSKDIIAVGFGNWGDAGEDSTNGFRNNVKLLADSVLN